MPKRVISIILILSLFAAVASACGSSGSSATEQSEVTYKIPKPKETAPDKTSDGKVGVNLVKEIRVKPLNSSEDETVYTLTRNEYGNPVECRETNSKTGKDEVLFTMTTSDVAFNNGRGYASCAASDESGDIQYGFNEDRSLHEIKYDFGYPPYTFGNGNVRKRSDTVTETVEYNSNGKPGSKKFRDVDSGDGQLEEVYHYDENGLLTSIENIDSKSNKTETKREYCAAGNYLDDEKCDVEYDDAGNITLEHHGSREYSYEYDKDGNLTKSELTADGAKTTHSYAPDGRLETVVEQGDGFERTIVYETFYVKDDSLLLFFIKNVNHYIEFDIEKPKTFYNLYQYKTDL